MRKKFIALFQGLLCLNQLFIIVVTLCDTNIFDNCLIFCFGRFLAKTAELNSGICEGLDAPSFPCKYHKHGICEYRVLVKLATFSRKI